MQPLDNPVWHALTGPQANVAEGTDRARRYQPEYSVFAALPDDPDARAWAELATVIGPDGTAILVPRVEPPTHWECLGTFAVHQMVAERAVPVPQAASVVALGPADVKAMNSLITAAQPGPWVERTHELGAFFGIRVDGTLVAMAGQRMRLPTATEISAVATHPDGRGRGYAAAVTAACLNAIVDVDRQPFLHVMHTNESAIRVYEGLGFAIRTTFDVGRYRVRSGSPIEQAEFAS